MAPPQASPPQTWMPPPPAAPPPPAWAPPPPPAGPVVLTPADIQDHGPYANPLAADPSTRSSVLFALPPERTLRRQGGLMRMLRQLLTWCVVLAVVGGLGAGGYYVVTRYLSFPTGPGDKPIEPGKPGGPLVFESEPLNYRFPAPPEPWLQDNVTRPAGKAASVVMQRSKPTAWLALVAQDHSKGRQPRDAEVVDEAIRKLQVFFKDTMDYEQKPDAQLAGHRAQRLAFRGVDGKNVLVNGECYLLVHKGVVYWFLTWAPATDIEQAQKEFDDLRQRFTLQDKRDSWPDKTPKSVTLEGTKADYTLEDLDDVWKKQARGTDYDPAADMALTANDQVEMKNVVRFAQVLVLVLKPQDKRTPEAVARAYYESRQKEQVEVEVATDLAGPANRPGLVGDVPGHILKLRVRKPDKGERLVYLAVTRQGDNLVAIQGECDWKRRSLWERDFSRLASTFRLKK